MDPSNFENMVNNEVIIEQEVTPFTFLQVGVTVKASAIRNYST